MSPRRRGRPPEATVSMSCLRVLVSDLGGVHPVRLAGRLAAVFECPPDHSMPGLIKLGRHNSSARRVEPRGWNSESDSGGPSAATRLQAVPRPALQTTACTHVHPPAGAPSPDRARTAPRRQAVGPRPGPCGGAAARAGRIRRITLWPPWRDVRRIRPQQRPASVRLRRSGTSPRTPRAPAAAGRIGGEPQPLAAAASFALCPRRGYAHADAPSATSGCPARTPPLRDGCSRRSSRAASSPVERALGGGHGGGDGMIRRCAEAGLRIAHAARRGLASDVPR